MATENDPLMTTQELMEYIKVSRATIYVMMRDGRMPAPIRFFSDLRWRKSVIDEWLEGTTVPRESPAPAE